MASAFFSPDPASSSNLTHNWSEKDVEVASIAAINFSRAFYESYDKPADRLPLLAPFYRERSSLVWNGNRAQGIVEIGEALARVPPSKHEIVAVDSTPIAGTSPPRLLVTVTGIVRHVDPSKLTSQTISARSLPQHTTETLPTTSPAGTEIEYVIPHSVISPMVTDAGGSGKNRGKEMMDEATIKGLPRTFVEVFELVANEEGTGNENPQPGYHILRDTFRFVG
ncbi:hypothetical protein HD553DRAFT_76278 [Filobasidium floriforme]|uniref:uncharacterized protein n=1 Tax=Filobasidium floriforme TaxID=5210 RepID=UPI001E8D08BF|nr:uncharacterized protein HD553DRAFT_76278 [Filobasidium floriforme]KAH8081864.1 hypothetical protein HD553DRAFT_76278 [Filobasidium floriforme]